MPREIPEVARGVLRSVGWMPGRRIDILPWVSEWGAVGVHAHEAVDRAHAREIGAGNSFDFDPHKCAGEQDRFLELGG